MFDALFNRNQISIEKQLSCIHWICCIWARKTLQDQNVNNKSSSRLLTYSMLGKSLRCFLFPHCTQQRKMWDKVGHLLLRQMQKCWFISSHLAEMSGYFVIPWGYDSLSWMWILNSSWIAPIRHIFFLLFTFTNIWRRRKKTAPIWKHNYFFILLWIFCKFWIFSFSDQFLNFFLPTKS